MQDLIASLISDSRLAFIQGKGAKSYSECTTYKKYNIPISQEYRTRMIAKEAELEPILQGMIDGLVGK